MNATIALTEPREKATQKKQESAVSKKAEWELTVEDKEFLRSCNIDPES